MKFCSLLTSAGLQINANSQSYFENLRVRKISTNKRLRVGIMQISQTFGQNLLQCGLTNLLVEKILMAKIFKWIKNLTSSLNVCKGAKRARLKSVIVIVK